MRSMVDEIIDPGASGPWDRSPDASGDPRFWELSGLLWGHSSVRTSPHADFLTVEWSS